MFHDNKDKEDVGEGGILKETVRTDATRSFKRPRYTQWAHTTVYEDILTAAL